MTLRRLTLIASALGAVILLSACRVDVVVHVDVNANGSGKITLTATADKDIVTAEPTIATDLRLEDVLAAGWKAQKPKMTKDGGLQLVLSHTFSNPATANALLAHVSGPNGPLHDLLIARAGKDTNTTWTIAGRLEVTGGLEAFVDDKTLALLGGAPYAAEVKRSGLDLGDAVAITFEAVLPGKIKTTTANVSNGSLTWRVPMDGTSIDLASTSENLDIASNVARAARPLLKLLIALWVIAMLVLLGMVIRAQDKRTPRS
ncbi:MAG: hypothetical protein EXQ63_06290 [Ilumatobacteraceae bacterium]|nr:hypothetical protein [Ilumatobacteraceae bacterium]